MNAAEYTRIVLVLAKDPILPSLDETLFAQTTEEPVGITDEQAIAISNEPRYAAIPAERRHELARRHLRNRGIFNSDKRNVVELLRGELIAEVARHGARIEWRSEDGKNVRVLAERRGEAAARAAGEEWMTWRVIAPEIQNDVLDDYAVSMGWLNDPELLVERQG